MYVYLCIHIHLYFGVEYSEDTGPRKASRNNVRSWTPCWLGSSISDHMYRMAVLAMCTTDTSLDVPKYVYCTPAVCNACPRTSIYIRCVMMAIVHDLAEAQGWHNEEREPICLNLPRSRRYCTAGGHIKGRKKEIGRSMYDSNLLYHQTISVLQEAMHSFVHDMLHFSPPAQRIYALWKVCTVIFVLLTWHSVSF